MKKQLIAIAALVALAFPIAAQHLTGTFTSGITAASVCGTGVTTNCEVGTGIYDNTSVQTFTNTNLLCTAAGAAATYSCSISESTWPVFTTHTITAESEYYGATAGTLLTTTAVTTGAGGNQIQVENLLILAPTAVAGSVTAMLVTAPAAARGWLMWAPATTEQLPLTATLG